MEEWAPIPLTFYEISNTRKVRNYRGQLLKVYSARFINYPRGQVKYRGKYVKINGRITYISDLLKDNAPNTMCSGIIWPTY